jgi:hypothetical protein
MKIALCYSGQVGRFWEIYPNHKQTFIKGAETDIFIHTSDAITQKRNLQPHLSPRDKIIKDYLPGYTGWHKMSGTYGKIYNIEVNLLIDKLTKTYGNQIKKIRIESEDINQDNNEIEKITKWEWLKKRQLYKMYACNQLVQEHEKENNFMYDIIIRSRFDCVLKTDIYIKKIVQQIGDINNKIFVFGGWQCPKKNRFMDHFLFDGFAFGGPKAMDTFCSLHKKKDAYPAMEKYKEYQKNWGDNVEYQLHKHLQENNVEIVYLNNPNKQLDSPDCGRWLYEIYR